VFSSRVLTFQRRVFWSGKFKLNKDLRMLTNFMKIKSGKIVNSMNFIKSICILKSLSRSNFRDLKKLPLHFGQQLTERIALLLDDITLVMTRSWATWVKCWVTWPSPDHALEMVLDPTQPEHTFDLQLIRGRPVFDLDTFWPRPDECFF